MIARVTNRNFSTYKYKKRKASLKIKITKENIISFSEILENVQMLRKKGIISVSDLNRNISKSIKK
ncbi:hypothetical protein [Clostridium beijerinckii]|uniref:AAA+ superfamily ATPase n=1 Tax=Clostridium beijerinckii TaxID=1520 RepID=A0A1B9BQF4_CLOBE|nr:hypothetical protein [Clostridium beijerinckii]AQS02725.1 hypothetical protein CLBIJ_00840 [Clostridium beijerinckii]MBA2887761.1 putative AAA+ superfamily ATPase [Clostridium beijerinckii]MBA2902559.1 putative AAA+ superfamily ATPase [Clostridium beijerinckii]MBA2912319.1 putative AAA+ superfamily ATPase [Clostridium beijerinckii]MBA9017744.1 putative AAA+ superfamily ATPase [Clostridium beijerinckii]